MTNTGSIIGGILLTILAGVCNGSWNAAFNEDANLAVGKVAKSTLPIDDAKEVTASDSNSLGNTEDTNQQNDIKYHHAFALYQIYAVIINIPICIGWIGGFNRVNDVLSQSSTKSIVLVILFSMIWGVGTVLFGVACKVAGVGLGTNLTMGVVAVTGTLLPMIYDNTLISVSGAVILTGVAICCFGLALATKALAMKDSDEVVFNNESNLEDPGQESGGVLDQNIEITGIGTEKTSSERSTQKMSIANRITRRFSTYFDIFQKQHHYSTFQKMSICVIAGLTCSMLQFAFIFGDDIKQLTASYTDSVQGSDAVIIWLLAISCGAPASILNGIYSSTDPLSVIWNAPWYRHLLILLTTSLPWVAHIHIYGLCTSLLLPANMAASIAWPLLMLVTTLQALLLSIILGEWKIASRNTKRMLMFSLGTTLIGLFVLMSSVATSD